ncbi:hypothetical protein CGC59_11225 [Capnocytophaga sputigena]|jgi:hypothetical protein|uniref:Uncharacterized protein n=1 Tax=Capnocytophaga sputigena TaxID=1019 RepID=A0A250F537_CAPSP|nr:hypothetical protein CGC59_11225 [Capnocytophaga sputigena]
MVENNRFIRCFLFEGKGSNKFSINKFYNLLKLKSYLYSLASYPKTGTLIADFPEIKYKSPNYILQYFEQKGSFPQIFPLGIGD